MTQTERTPSLDSTSPDLDPRLPGDPTFVEPQAPHDDLPFEDLAGRYNFERTSTDVRTFARLVMKECAKRPAPVRAVDIGCGQGLARRAEYQVAIRELVDEYWGVEPDERTPPPEGLFDHHRTALMEDADLPAAHFDLAYSSMVMEHVADPDAFMAALFRCLKPGGVYVFLTPNRRHYFTRIASLLHRLRLDEIVLRRLKPGHVDEYHYPVAYRFNDEASIDACAKRLGFLPPEYAYLEAQGPRTYFPKPLRFVFHLLAAKRRLVRNPRSLLVLACRITKPPAA